MISVEPRTLALAPFLQRRFHLHRAWRLPYSHILPLVSSNVILQPCHRFIKTTEKCRKTPVPTDGGILHAVDRAVPPVPSRCGGDWSHPQNMASDHVDLLLAYLAACRRVVASTQNHALDALVFLFRDAIKKGIGEFVSPVLPSHQYSSILVHRD